MLSTYKQYYIDTPFLSGDLLKENRSQVKTKLIFAILKLSILSIFLLNLYSVYPLELLFGVSFLLNYYKCIYLYIVFFHISYNLIFIKNVIYQEGKKKKNI